MRPFGWGSRNSRGYDDVQMPASRLRYPPWD